MIACVAQILSLHFDEANPMAFFSKKFDPARFLVLLISTTGAIFAGLVIWGLANRPNWDKLSLGMTRAQVESVMGEPIYVLEWSSDCIELGYPGNRGLETKLILNNDSLEFVQPGGAKGDGDLRRAR
jgi:hypothetical protein